MNRSKFSAILFSSLFAVAAVSPMAYGEVLVYSDFDTWLINRDTTVSGTQQSQTLTDTANTSVAVNQYGGPLELSRVVISYIQPEAPTSGDVSGTISITGGSGTVIFSSASATASTSITATDLFVPILLLGGGAVANPSIASDADDLGAFTLTDAETAPVSMEYQQNTILWDSADHTLSGTLDSIFQGNGTFSFAVASSVAFQFARDNTLGIQLQTSGTDSGRVQIDYYTAQPVPEPASVALSVMGGGLALGLVRRLRRRK